jgi:hypothetical protein
MTTTTGKDFLILTLEPASGDILWFARYLLPTNLDQGDEVVTGMSVNATEIYVTGFSLLGNNKSRILTVKFIR